MELTIKYRAGVMTIHVDRFLDCTNLKDFKKLLKIINTSYTPEVREQLKEYITNYLQTSNEKLKGNKPMPVGWFYMTDRTRKRYEKFLDLL